MCGIIGIVGHKDCAANMLIGLQALQHRGQDSAGVGTIIDDRFPVVRKLGLVSQSFSDSDCTRLPGTVGIGHVRYPTIGQGVLRDTQPFFYRQPGVLMAHNGNFTNVFEMHDLLRADSVHLLSRCDVEPVLCLFALALMQQRRRDHTTQDALAALVKTFKQASGSYSIVVAMMLDGEESLLAVRDPHGLRPAVWGSMGEARVVASESVALDALNAKLEGDVAPGEAMILRRNKPPRRYQLFQPKPAPCVFEYIYFARPDSNMNGRSIYNARIEMGRELAKAWQAKGLQADVVIPIPDTARPSAAALAEELALPYREGFIKNRYTGRTFIMPNADARNSTLTLKLNTIHSEFAGKSVLVVDDSIVRGTTLNHTIQLIRAQGARQVHLAIHSPPVLYPCYYGIDMSTRQELVAPGFLPDHEHGPLDTQTLRRLENLYAARLGLDSLTYLPIAGLRRACPGGHCAACFDDDYPLTVTREQRTWIEQDRHTSSTQTEMPF